MNVDDKKDFKNTDKDENSKNPLKIHDEDTGEKMNNQKSENEDSNQKNNFEEDDNPNSQVENKRLAFDSLISVEKEHIFKRLKKQVLNQENQNENFCTNFIMWIWDQFKQIGVSPPSMTLITNLQFLKKNVLKPGLFVNPGNEELINLYYGCIENEIEQNYEDQELDVDSLAIATQKYIEKNIKFFSRDIFIRIYEVYNKNHQKAYTMKRIPFLILNRPIFGAVADIIHHQDKNQKETGIDLKKSAKIWKDTLLNDDLKENFSVTPQIKTKILEDLLNTEFLYLSPEFYSDTRDES